MPNETGGASTPQEDEGVYIERVRVSDGDAASYEPLRQALNEKTSRGWLLLSMVKDPAGDSVELVWAKRGRHKEAGGQDEERSQSS